MIQKYLLVNNFSETLEVPIGTEEGGLDLSSIAGLPNPVIDGITEEILLLTIQDKDDKSKVEIIRVWSAATNPIGVQRGYSGTTPQAFSAGALVEFRLNAEIM